MPYSIRIPAMMLFTLLLSMALVPDAISVSATPAPVEAVAR